METLKIEFPDAIIKASELLANSEALSCYPISRTVAGIVAPFNSLTIFRFTSSELVKLVRIYYRVIISDVGAFGRIPTILNMEITSNPLSQIVNVGDGVVQTLGGSLKTQEISLALPREQSYIDLEKYPFQLLPGYEFSPVVSYYDPAILVTDSINLQFTFVFSK